MHPHEDRRIPGRQPHCACLSGCAKRRAKGRSGPIGIDAPLSLVQANIRDFDLPEVVRHFEFFSIEDDGVL